MDSIADWSIHHFQKELGVIMGAPVLSFAAICLAFLVAYFVIGKMHEARHAAHTGTVEQKNAHIALLEGQLGEYKSKLTGATPDEVAHEISSLNSDLANTRAQMAMIAKWYQYQTSERHLSSEQKEALSSALYDAFQVIPEGNRSFIAIAAISEPEAQQYAIEIMDAFRSQGFCLQQKEPYWMHSSTPDERGLLVVVVDENNPPEHAVVIMAALKQADIEAKFDSFSAGLVHPLACNLAVSHKLPLGNNESGMD
jgi:hypothetical protein